MDENQEMHVSGTLVWYYYICPREVWLIGHQIAPDQDDANVSLGRFIQDYSCPRERKELAVGNSKMDVFKLESGELLIGEVKETNFRRFTLNLDLLEIFKPIIVDRIIFTLVAKRWLQNGTLIRLPMALCLKIRPKNALLRSLTAS
jgi:hypothetical protein